MCIMEYQGMQVLNKSFKNLLKECDDSSKQNNMFWPITSVPFRADANSSVNPEPRAHG